MMPSRRTMVPRGITRPGAVTVRAPTIAGTRGLAALGVAGDNIRAPSASGRAYAVVRRLSHAVRRAWEERGANLGMTVLPRRAVEVTTACEVPSLGRGDAASQEEALQDA